VLNFGYVLRCSKWWIGSHHVLSDITSHVLNVTLRTSFQLQWTTRCFFPKYIRSKILSNCSSLYSLFSPEFQSQPFPMEFPGISRDPNAMEFCWAKIPRSIRWKVSRNLHASGLSFQHSRLGSTKQCAEWYFSQKKDVGTFAHTCGYLQNIYQLNVLKHPIIAHHVVYPFR